MMETGDCDRLPDVAPDVCFTSLVGAVSVPATGRDNPGPGVDCDRLGKISAGVYGATGVVAGGSVPAGPGCGTGL